MSRNSSNATSSLIGSSDGSAQQRAIRRRVDSDEGSCLRWHLSPAIGLLLWSDRRIPAKKSLFVSSLLAVVVTGGENTPPLMAVALGYDRDVVGVVGWGEWEVEYLCRVLPEFFRVASSQCCVRPVPTLTALSRQDGAPMIPPFVVCWWWGL